jgi:HAE1 family hydrophobic/amphiphilic exporter-1
MGKSPFESAYEGAREVWGAILASTLTTVAVFLPVVFMKEEAGQLFRDIAIAVTCAVTLSLFVSVSVIPMFAKQLFSLRKYKKSSEQNRFTVIGNNLKETIMRMVQVVVKNWKTRLITIISLTALSILSAWALTPKMEYLPQGNRNLVINILIPPPGLSYEEKKDIGDQLFQSAEPYMKKDHEGIPGIKNMFYVGSDRFNIAGAISIHEQRAGELLPLFMRTINSLPGMFGISLQAGIFQTRLGRGRTIDVDVSSNDLNRVVQVAGSMFGVIKKEIPGAQIRPIPSLELLFPEVRLIPQRDRLKASGMAASDLGISLDVLMDGRKIGDFKQEGKKKIDMVLKASEKDISTPENKTPRKEPRCYTAGYSP